MVNNKSGGDSSSIGYMAAKVAIRAVRAGGRHSPRAVNCVLYNIVRWLCIVINCVFLTSHWSIQFPPQPGVQGPPEGCPELQRGSLS